MKLVLLRHPALAACVWLAAAVAQSRPSTSSPSVRPSLPSLATAHFELTFAPGVIEGCPESAAQKQRELYAARLEQLHARLGEVLAPPAAAAPRFSVAVVSDTETFEQLVAADTDLETQGIGARSPARGACVLLHAPKLVRDDATLHRLVVHQVVHLLLVQEEPKGELATDWGWFEEGLAHWFEADRGAGVAEHLCHLERSQPPRTFWNGRWRTAARELLERDRLPALDELLGRAAVDLNPEQRAAAFAWVDHLTRLAAPAVTPGPAKTAPPPPLPALLLLLRAAKAGEPAAPAFRRSLGLDLPALEQRWRAWIKAEYPRA